MNLLNILLLAHLTGAVATGFFILKAFINLLKNQASTYKSSAIQIGVGAGYQLITGSFLAMNSNTSESLLAFCSKMGLYIGIVLFVEALLFLRMQKDQMWIKPAQIAFSSLSIGIVFTLYTVFHIYGNI